jgi:MFS family permease
MATTISFKLQQRLSRSKGFFIVWCMMAAFGTYFCMYAFRKPFSAGTYSEYKLWGLDYKAVLIIAQVFGYMLSKFAGIKVISELEAASRKRLIIGLIIFAELSLLLFGVVPYPYNFIFLFANGLPLGMVWGVVFSYLEGRRFTEVLGTGLSISLIVSSGILKTFYFFLHELVPSVTEFWLPAVIGLIFLPLFMFFVWMLSIIPAPTQEDIASRSARTPMSKEDKRKVLRDYGLGLLGFIVIYALLATMRDFRDNFSVEIWKEIEVKWNKAVFAQTETISGFIVLMVLASLSLIKSNIKGFWVTSGLIAFGLLLGGLSTALFQLHMLSPFWWMVLLGMGLFLAYIPMQVALFERTIALFRMRANAGFFVYICDATGYLGSVGLTLYKEFFMKDLNWSKLLINFSYLQSVVSLGILLFTIIFFYRRKRSLPAIEKMPVTPIVVVPQPA